MKTIKPILGLLIVFSFIQCARPLTSNIENARQALNEGDLTTAINLTQDVLADDPGNLEASTILASALFERSNLNFLDLTQAMLDLDNDDDSNFQAIADALPDEGDLDDLRAAIVALEAISGIDEDDIGNNAIAGAAFDLAFMEAIEHFAIGVYQSGFKAGNFDVTTISADNTSEVQEDLIEFDNRLIGAGVDETETFISDVRQTFCILEPISATDGFTTAEYQALVACQLSDNPDTFDTTALTADIANCNAINPNNQNAAVESCYDDNTSL